ncbi:hypothetical protein ACJZ2D_004911 [Fusarium nematophilum]
METQPQEPSALEQVLPHIHRTPEDPRPVVVMTCGIAGAGKSTLAKAIVTQQPNFLRLSGDEIIHQKHGLYAIDYSADQYEAYQTEAQKLLKAELVRILREKQRDIVLDLSFYNWEYRNEYRDIIEPNGGRCVLVFLDADNETLWRRIGQRRAKRDALDVADKNRDGDSAYNIDEETFEMYCDGFERPEGEGELVIKVV